MFMDHPLLLLTGISLLAAGLEVSSKDHIISKDLVWLPQHQRHIITQRHTRRMVTPPPAKKLSPIVIRMPHTPDQSAFIWIQWVQGCKVAITGPIMAFLIVMGTYIQHSQIVIA